MAIYFNANSVRYIEEFIYSQMRFFASIGYDKGIEDIKDIQDGFRDIFNSGDQPTKGNIELIVDLYNAASLVHLEYIKILHSKNS